jgi:carboxymethylenebutenolidase
MVADMAITTRTDRIAAHDGGQFDGHVWLPDRGSGPGMLLLQEIFGVGPYIRSVAERLASAGYVVLAPDVFWRINPNWEADHDEQGLNDSISMMGKFDFVQGVDDCVAAAEHLERMSEVRDGTGVIGFCMGGLLTYHVAARAEPRVAISYYGSNIAASLDLASTITCPIIFHFGERDAYIPLEQVEQIRVTFADRTDAPVHVHDAGHAFDNHEAPMFFDADAAKAAWALTAEFLATHLPA